VRGLVAFLALLATCVLVPATVATTWVRADVVATSGYVDTVAPLATDPAVVRAVEDRLVASTVRQLATWPRWEDVPASVRTRARDLASAAVVKIVEDPAFADTWEAANRVTHREVVGVLSGRSESVTVGPGSTVEISLAPLTDEIRRELVARGVPFAASLPRLRAGLPVGTVAGLSRAQRAYSLLERWGPVLPFVTGGLLVLGLVLARRRVRAVGLTALGSAVGIGALGVGLYVARTTYLDAVPGSVPQDAATALFDAVTEGLRRDIGLVGIAAVAVFAVATIASAVTRSH
jgi:hypothetical protein